MTSGGVLSHCGGRAAGARQETLRIGPLGSHQAAGHCAFLPSMLRLRLPLAVPRSGPVGGSLWKRVDVDLAHSQERTSGAAAAV